MTFREKLAQEQPHCIGGIYIGGCHGCPHEYGYEQADSDNMPCKGAGHHEAECRACWDREMPSLKHLDIESFTHEEKPVSFNQPAPEKTVELDFLKTGTGLAMGKIKDSGDRTEFATGAVRDMREGKGRCDLMPLRVAGLVMQGDAILDYIGLFQDTGDVGFLYSAIKHFAHAFSGLASMLLEVAKHFEEGAKKYGENNWQKGIPVHCYIDSAVRHYLKWLRGDKDEPHDRAFVWNLMCCIWEVDYSPRAKEETDVGVLKEKAEETLRQIDNKPVEAVFSEFEVVQMPACKATKQFRLGDCPAGMFNLQGRRYVKVNTNVINGMYVDVVTGNICELPPDIAVTPLEILEELK